MKPQMALMPTLETSSLQAVARFQEPDVQLTHVLGSPPAVQLEEGGVVVVLEFSDRDALGRFLRRLTHLSFPSHG